MREALQHSCRARVFRQHEYIKEALMTKIRGGVMRGALQLSCRARVFGQHEYIQEKLAAKIQWKMFAPCVAAATAEKSHTTPPRRGAARGVSPMPRTGVAGARGAPVVLARACMAVNVDKYARKLATD
jgi:hypothetical protein